MQAAAHDKAFAEKMGIPQEVAREYVKADARNKRFVKSPGHPAAGGLDDTMLYATYSKKARHGNRSTKRHAAAAKGDGGSARRATPYEHARRAGRYGEAQVHRAMAKRY